MTARTDTLPRQTETPAGGGPIPHDCDVDVSIDLPKPPLASSSRRLVGVDVARGLAIVGMMVVHILPPIGANGEMSVPWALTVGKSAALFAVLAGVSIAFSSGGRRRPEGARRDAAAVSLLVRALMIGAVGLLLGYVVPSEGALVILAYYAVLFVLALPLLGLSRRALVALAVGITVTVPVLSHVLRAQLPPELEANPTFSDALADPVHLVADLALTGAFPALPWLAYVCVGLAVGRSQLGSRGVVVRIGIIGLAVAIASSAGSWLLMTVAGGWEQLQHVALTTMSATEYSDAVVWGFAGTTPTSTLWWLGVMSPHSSTPFDIGFTIGVALAALAAAILLGQAAGRLLNPIAAAGTMTFTLYTLHLLMISSSLRPETPALDFAVQVTVVVCFAVLWSRRFTRGPLEHAVWWVTHHVRDKVLEASADRPAPSGGSDGGSRGRWAAAAAAVRGAAARGTHPQHRAGETDTRRSARTA